MGSEEVPGLEFVPRPLVLTATSSLGRISFRKACLSPALHEASTLGSPLAFPESNETVHELGQSVGWLP